MSDFAVVHGLVDDIGEKLASGTHPRFLGSPRLSEEALDEILAKMRDVPGGYERELVWHLVLQGYDRRILATASGSGRKKYREITKEYAVEVERPEDAPDFAFWMPWKPPARVRDVMDSCDRIGECLQRAYHDLGGYEDVGDGRGRAQIGGQDELIPGENEGFAMAMDGRIWRLDWECGEMERFAEPARMPSGAARHPHDPERVFFCATRWSKRVPETGCLGGIYEFRTDAPGKVETVALRVPWRKGLEWGERDWQPIPDETMAKVYTQADIDARALTFDQLKDVSVSRPICYCNDLALSADGRYVYFTAPSPYTSMGLESRIEVVKLTQNGRLWRIDLQAGTVSLAAEGFAFIDGVLVRDEDIIVTELPRFRMLRLDLAGGTSEPFLTDLPGMPDGMARYDGKIWQALLHERTLAITAIHRWPWLKWLYQTPLLPAALKKAPRGCGILVLDEQTLEPLYCTMHDGSRIHHIASVSPLDESRIFLPSFHEENRGVHWIDDPTRGSSA